MRKKYIFGKKLYISVLTSILVLLTTVATTFAWVGVFANSTFETFNIDLKASHLDEYGIEISLTGEEGTFSDSISGTAVKYAILKNWGYSDYILSQNNIDDLFNSLNMEQCTTIPNLSNNKLKSLGTFKNIEGNDTNAYFKFDVYVSAVRFYDKGTSSDYKLDVFLNEGLITGHPKSRLLTNPFIYPDTFSNPLAAMPLPTNISPIGASTYISNATVDSKSVCRVAFEKYEVVAKGHPEQYTNASEPLSTIIYTGDSYEYPTKNTDSNVYEFGGILSDDLNLAVGYYNSTEWWYSRAGIKTISVLDTTADIYGGDVYNIRGVGQSNPDILFSSKTNHLLDSQNNFEKVGIDDMMKITVSFWIEGWDADCFNAIGNSPVTLAISMSITNEDEF